MKRLLSKILIIVCILFSLSNNLFSVEIPKEYSLSNLIGFSQNLISSGEYYRSYIELNRILAYYGDSIPHDLMDRINLSKNYVLYFNNIIDNDLSESDSFFNFTTIAANSILLYDLSIKSGKKLNFKFKYKKYDNEMRSYIDKRMLKDAFLTGDRETVLSLIRSKKSLDEYAMLAMYDLDDRYKNPVVGSLWGIFPGGGYIYASNTKTGIVAMIVIAVNFAVSMLAFHSDNEVVGSMTATIGTLFYGGSILGGYMESKRYNRGIRQSTERYLEKRMRLQGDRDRLYMKYGLGGYNEAK